MCKRKIEAKRPAVKSRRRKKADDDFFIRFKPQENKPCRLNFDHIDDLDEISGDEQLCLILCEEHGYEWRWLDRRLAGLTR